MAERDCGTSWLRKEIRHEHGTTVESTPVDPGTAGRLHERQYKAARRSDARLALTERREFIYTTIGDMVKDSRALGYDYMPPKHADLSREDYQEWPQHCYIVFSGVRCTKDTYRIDLFINQDNPQPADATLQNPHYVGQIMRLGMGIDDDKGRCISHGVTRVLDASFAAYALELTDSSPSTINMIVTEGTKQRVLPPEEYQQLPGFAPAAVWGASIPAMQRLHQEQQSSTVQFAR